jgi:hypothetical protein
MPYPTYGTSDSRFFLYETAYGASDVGRPMTGDLGPILFRIALSPDQLKGWEAE